MLKNDNYLGNLPRNHVMSESDETAKSDKSNDTDKTVLVELRGRVPKDLKRRFKSRCADLDRSMEEVLVEIVEKWLKEG